MPPSGGPPVPIPNKLIFPDILPCMNWINLETSTLDSPEFLGAEPIERATWLCLLRYCVGQENGGRIAGCRDWKDRRCQQLVRVTAREIGSACDLWSWDGDDLVVFEYPTEKEAEVKQRRETAKTNGRNGGRPKKNQPESHEKPTSETEPKPTSVISEKAEGEGEGEGEEKEKGREVNYTPDATRSHAIPSLAEVKAYARSGPVPISEACAVAFHDTQEAAGWITKHGHSIADWRAALRRYASHWNEVEKGKSTRTTSHSTRPPHRQGEFPEPKIELPSL